MPSEPPPVPNAPDVRRARAPWRALGASLVACGLAGCVFWDMGDFDAHEHADAASPQPDAGPSDGDAAPDAVIASDTFTREVTAGLGHADVGGDWIVENAASAFAVHGNTARLTSDTGQTTQAHLPAFALDVDTHLTFAASAIPNGNGLYIFLRARISAAADKAYAMELRVGQTSTNAAIKLADGTSLVAVGNVLDYAAGKSAHMRLQAVGKNPTHLRGKFWMDGSPEPATFGIAVDDSTAAMQAPGGVGIGCYVSAGSSSGPVVTSFDDFEAR